MLIVKEEVEVYCNKRRYRRILFHDGSFKWFYSSYIGPAIIATNVEITLEDKYQKIIKLKSKK